MSWSTVIWSMVASACLTLGTIYGVVWYWNRGAWALLLFSVTAVSTTAFTFCELAVMRAQTAAELVAALRWTQLASFFLFVSITWFVRLYLRAGRPWLAWTITGMSTFYLLLTFLTGINVNYLVIPSPRRIQFLGESVAVLGGVPNPLTLFGQLALLLILVFVVDASVTASRRGDRRKARTVGGSIVFFILAGLATSSIVVWGRVPGPLVVSPLYLGLIVVMGYELSRDLLRAAQLVDELQISEAGLRESEARMSLAVDAADIGLWIQDFARNEIWASAKWRELFGFSPSEPLDPTRFSKRCTPMIGNDSGKRAIGGRYQAEYRLVQPDGAIRWISSQGRVEWSATGQPVLRRGAARDVTAQKHADAVVHNLSGRLLSAQEQERRRIARELHDNLAQQMALLSIEIEQLGMSQAGTDLAEPIRQIGTRTAEISKEIHALSHRLHSTKLETLGLEAAVRGHCRELRAEGVEVQYVAENVPGGLPYDVALCLFRIVQEGLYNVVKHSGAHEAHVTLAGAKDEITLTIADSGRGFAEAAASSHGLGLASMRERVHLIGGDLTLESHPGRGTTIIARVPIAEAGHAAAGPPLVARGYDAAPASAPPRPRSVADGDSPNTDL